MAQPIDTAHRAGPFGRWGDVVVRRPWLVVAIWVVLAVALPLASPTLTEVAQRHPVAALPANAPSVVADEQMAAAFGEPVAANFLTVVLTNENGLGPADEATYRTLVERLRQDTTDVVVLQDFLRAPALREAMTSKDGKAWRLPVGLAGT